MKQQQFYQPTNDKETWTIHKLKTQEFRDNDIPLPFSLEDIQLTEFMRQAKENSIERTTTIIIRLKDVDYLDKSINKKRKEFIIYRQDWRGSNSNNNPIIPMLSDLVFGEDYIFLISRLV